ncbi:hypothetical protein OOT00_08695 [Desulfobotulus sp. H1]|uniref:Type II secretion system protein M n=1 Tax=Desulfobotulus pelophilus TaxID=2823377 RepID=A0ABT3N9C0_9BACT|nr:hypothetical protein [Desulfobotulus pelophilus]MCW7754063.1 hypothetical protein [Desulfobotulus pelophilus]
MARRLTKLEKFGLIAAVITGMIFLYLNKVYDPQQLAMQRAREQLNKTIRDYNDLQSAPPLFQLQQRLKAHREGVEELEKKLAARNMHAGKEERRMASLSWIYQQMEGRGMPVLESRPSGTRQELFTWHVYRFGTRGSFSDFTYLLQRLEKSPLPLKVEAIEIKRPDKGWPLAISMDIWIMG